MAKKNFINTTHIEGYLYEHDLKKKVTGPNSKAPGTEFINGKISVATDEDLLNVVDVHFTYVTASTKNGKPNATFNLLNSIIEGTAGTVMKDGKENAIKVRIDSALTLNEWYDERTEGKPLISTKRNEGGFVHQTQELTDKLEDRATFETDMVITGVTRKEADPEKDLSDRVTLKGYVFNFRGEVKPMEYSVYEPYAPAGALDYFENLGATGKSPVFTKVQGRQISRTIVKRKEEASAFGDVRVIETTSSQRDFVVTWAQAEPYEWDSEESILASELANKLAEREVYLADIKKRQDEYRASKGNALAGATPVSVAAPAKGEYDF